MNWDAIGAIGQAVSALALVFVLVQLRHARQETRRSVSQARADGFRELWMLRANSPQLRGLLGRTEAALGAQQPFIVELAAKAKITFDEASQVHSHQWAWWMFQSQVIPFADELRPGERAQFDGGIRLRYENLPVGRLWFQTFKNTTLDPDAVRYVDNLLAQPG